MRLKQLPRQRNLLRAFCVGILLLTILPPQLTFASVVKAISVTNTVSEFATGSFQRAEMSGYTDTTLSQDKEGSVQLSSVNLFKFQDDASSKRLPYNLIRMGVATVGNRIFVIGGIAQGGTDVTYNNDTIDKVLSAEITPTKTSELRAGDITSAGWVSEPSLPAMQSSGATNFTTATSILHSPAVTSVTVGGKSYIYVIGGNTRIGASTRDFSSYAVRMAAIGSNGRISSWTPLTGAQIPLIDSHSGLQGASAVTLTVNGTAYVYLIGGLHRYLEAGTNMVEFGSKAVFWAKVDASTGKLLKPSTGAEGWDRMSPDLRISDPATSPTGEGLWDAAAVAGQYQINSDEFNQDKVIYIFGGQTMSENISGSSTSAFNATVFRLNIDSSTGEPARFVASGDADTLIDGRAGLGAVTYAGKHYVVGGAVLVDSILTPQRDMLTTYVEDDFTFPHFGDPVTGANFLSDVSALSSPHAYHGTAIIPAGDSAFVYVIGGQSNALAGNNPIYSDEVLFGRLGDKDTSDTVTYPYDGWYYSTPVRFDFLNAEVQEITWGALLDASNADMDLEISYRTSQDQDCSSATWTVDDWQTLDGNPSSSQSSVRGVNTITLPDVQARCFQYRAHMYSKKSLSGDLVSQTPSLLYLSLKVLVPGSPDLRGDLEGGKNGMEAVFNAKGQLTALNVRIRNHNDKEDLPTDSEPTQDADSDGSVGSFFVDLYVYKPGETPVAPTIPVTSDTHDVACTSIPTALMKANTTYQITAWSLITDQTCASNNADLLQFFPENGTYTVYLVIDSLCDNAPVKENGCIDETDALNGEANNVLAYTFTIDAGDLPPVSHDIRLPIILRK